MEIDEQDEEYKRLIDNLADLRFSDNLNIDYLNNRLLLCKTMQGFPSICESKTKTLVPLFSFYEVNCFYGMTLKIIFWIKLTECVSFRSREFTSCFS